MEEAPLPSPPAAEELRASFGDRKPPDISRKITACVACRKQKIKCHMRNSEPPCTRCKKRGLPCTVNRSLQMLLEDDVTWKNTITRKVRSLETAMDAVRERLSIPERSPSDTSFLPDAQHATHPHSPVDKRVPPSRSWEVVMDSESGPAAIPASCVAEIREPELPMANGSTASNKPDLVTHGVISFEQAQALFEVYSRRLDHFLYRILGDSDSLTSIRSDSPLLTAAICTVAALHSEELSYLYDRCYQQFVNLSAAHTFVKEYSLNDVRALCIGAFWLSDISWILNGVAVRIATQIQLHRSIHKALKGDRACYMQTRLYYLVYVCDHHFSIAYGRPPMTRECESIGAAARFLDTEHATEDDARLVSQVNIWSIASRVFENFGADVETPVPVQLIPQLRRFVIALDTWRADWNERFSPNRNVGNYPQKGVGLHYHFAKLYLCSHAFRGAPGSRTAELHELLPEMEEIANAAVLSAKSILRTIVSDRELQNYLNGLPLYFDTMIAFAVVFLLRVATKYSGTIRVDGTEILNLVGQVVTVLRGLTDRMPAQHLLVSVAGGVEKLLKKCQDQPSQSSLAPILNPYPAPEHTDLLGNNLDWIENMASYDFLSSQNNMSGPGSWSFDLELV